MKIWNSTKSPEGRTQWSVAASLKYQEQRVRQLVSSVRLRLTCLLTSKSDNYLAVLHEYGWVSFWSTDTWQLAYTFKLNNESKKIIFESSYRYLASLSVDGQVEVWRMKGEQAKYKWGLTFKSAT